MKYLLRHNWVDFWVWFRWCEMLWMQHSNWVKKSLFFYFELWNISSRHGKLPRIMAEVTYQVADEPTLSADKPLTNHKLSRRHPRLRRRRHRASKRWSRARKSRRWAIALHFKTLKCCFPFPTPLEINFALCVPLLHIWSKLLLLHDNPSQRICLLSSIRLLKMWSRTTSKSSI